MEEEKTYQVRERQVEAYQKIKHHAGEMLKAMGLCLENGDVKETPHRIAKSYVYELCVGLFIEKPRMTTFDQPGCDAMVVCKDVYVKSLCEHHMLPFYGKACVAYIPEDRILGLSKITRLVDWCARRPQVQERLTQMIAHELEKTLKPKGIAVFMQCTHLCMMLRGVKEEGLCATSAVMGNFKENPETRQEFFNILNVQGGYQWK